MSILLKYLVSDVWFLPYISLASIASNSFIKSQKSMLRWSAYLHTNVKVVSGTKKITLAIFENHL